MCSLGSIKMKFILAITTFTLLLTGCSQNLVSSSTNASSQTQQSSEKKQNSEQTINFIGPYDLTLSLTTLDNFETATLTDNSDKTYSLQRSISASGIRLTNDAGIIIHFKGTSNGNEGYVELVKDKPIEIKEFKPLAP